MNKKSQFEIGGMEINPKALLFGVLGAAISVFVMKSVQVNIVFRILTPIATFVVCYLLTSIQLRD